MASTSFDVGVGSSSGLSVPPVAFSLRTKQSVIRSPRLNRRPDRRLYSGNIAETPTSGSDRSRWPAFRWQLVHDMPPGARCGASAGVFVNSRKPRRISSDSGDLSSEASVSGFLGTSHAATIVTDDAT